MGGASWLYFLFSPMLNYRNFGRIWLTGGAVSKKHKISQKPKNHHEKGRFGHESENEKFDRYIDLPGAKKLTL